MAGRAVMLPELSATLLVELICSAGNVAVAADGERIEADAASAAFWAVADSTWRKGADTRGPGFSLADRGKTGACGGSPGEAAADAPGR